MKLDVRKTSAAFAAVAVGGVSSLFLGAAPASAAPGEPCLDGVLIAPGVCELVLTSGTATFTPAATMTQLEVLLVGAGGAGVDQAVANTNGYAAAGGGGEVTYVDFTGATDPIDLEVGQVDGPEASTADDGTISAFADNGKVGIVTGSGGTGGASGSGYVGGVGGLGGGAGADADATDENGGTGVVVADIVPDGSLFEDVTTCYGGGGAAGNDEVMGVADCGGGAPADATAATLLPPVANSGGGGGGVSTAQVAGASRGADGVVIVRWIATPVTLTFDMLGHGTAPAAQEIVPGTAPTAPAATPTADGYIFKGWFADAAFTTAADFSIPLTESTVYYAAWEKALAATGSTTAAAVMPIAVGALIAGAGLFVAASRRRRTN
jgi:uncharacterized repeat protein (TIGR02543 family)